MFDQNVQGFYLRVFSFGYNAEWKAQTQSGESSQNMNIHVRNTCVLYVFGMI